MTELAIFAWDQADGQAAFNQLRRDDPERVAAADRTTLILMIDAPRRAEGRRISDVIFTERAQRHRNYEATLEVVERALVLMTPDLLSPCALERFRETYPHPRIPRSDPI